VFVLVSPTVSPWLTWKLARPILVFGGMLTPIVPYIPRVHRALKLIDQARRDSANVVETKVKTELDQLTRERKTAEKDKNEASEKARQQRQTLDELHSRIDALSADRQLADFIERRRASTDYKQHLGVIAKAYSDFEELSTLLARVKNEITRAPATAKDTANRKLLPRIDRIVLYIDDLDRCPESKVVAVLQAIHLLLFFPLFVVVVGVDSRCILLSSSRRCFGQIRRCLEEEMGMIPTGSRLH